MPTMNIHVTGLEEVRRSLGRLAPAANDIMKAAINETAKAARGDLVAKARRTYMVKAGSFNKSMKLKRATKNSLTAVLHSRGKPIPLRGFVYIKHNVATGDPAAAHQIRGRRNFPLVINGRKAFYARMPQGHTGIFVRVAGSAETGGIKGRWEKNQKGKWELQKRRTRNKKTGEDLKPREQIRQLYGSSIPVMFGGTRVYDELKPQIEEKLHNRLENYVEQALRRL